METGGEDGRALNLEGQAALQGGADGVVSGDGVDDVACVGVEGVVVGGFVVSGASDEGSIESSGRL